MKAKFKSSWPENLKKPTKIKKFSSISLLKGKKDLDYKEVGTNRSDKIANKVQAIRNEIWRKKMVKLNKGKTSTTLS